MAGSLGSMLIGKISLGTIDFSKGSIGNVAVYSAGNIVTYHVDADVVYQEEVDADETALSPTTFTPAKEGWEFVGWRLDDAANGDVIDELVMGDDPITLYAIYQKNVTLSYNPNGANSGSVTSDTKQAYYNGSGTASYPTFTVKANAYTRPSYTFVSWRLDNATSGTIYYVNNTVTLASNAIMYAQWQALTALTVYSKADRTTAPSINNATYVSITATLYQPFTGTYQANSGAGGPGTASGTITINVNTLGAYSKASIVVRPYQDNSSNVSDKKAYFAVSGLAVVSQTQITNDNTSPAIYTLNVTSAGSVTITLTAVSTRTGTGNGVNAQSCCYIQSITLS